MKVWYIPGGFEDVDFDDDGPWYPWDEGISWDEVNLFVTFGDTKPKLNQDILMIGASIDAIVNAPMPLSPWPIEHLGKKFFHRVIEAVFDIDYKDRSIT